MGRRFSLQSKQMTLSAVPAGRVILIGGTKKTIAEPTASCNTAIGLVASAGQRRWLAVPQSYSAQAVCLR